MRVGAVHLFKTPLDSNYHNVVDFIFEEGISSTDISVRDILFNTFMEEYPARSTTSLNRSIKIINNRAVLSVYGDYESIRDYNYCVIDTGDFNVKFFFITGVISENDSTEKASTTIELLWDSWNNNIEHITREKCYNYIDCAHVDRYKLAHIVTPTDETYYIGMLNIIPNYPQIRNIATTKYNLMDTHKNKVLFLCLEMRAPQNDEDNPFIRGQLQVTNSVNQETVINDFNIKGLFSKQYKKEILYIPIGYNDGDKLIPVVFEGESVTYRDEQPPQGTIPYIDFTFSSISDFSTSRDNETLYSTLFSSLSSYIAKAYYTYYTPISYRMRSLSNIVVFPTPLISCDFGGVNVPVIASFYGSTDNEKEVDKIITNTYEDNIFEEQTIYKFNPRTLLGVPSLDFDLNEDNINTKYEVFNYQYPKKYISIVFNNETLPLIFPNKYIPETIEIKISLITAQPLMKIYADGEIIYDRKGYFLENNGLVTYSVDALDSYNIRNGSQHKIAKQMSIFNTIMGSAKSIANLGYTGNVPISDEQMLSQGFRVGGAIADTVNTIGSGIFKVKSYDAIIDDLSRTPSDYHSYSGENDILYQDRVMIFVNECEEIPESNLIIDNAFRFGYEFPRIDNVFNNTRLFFDFVRTSNCIIDFDINNIDRNTLQAILNRGVFKNHIVLGGTVSEPIVKYFNSSFKKDINTVSNIEHKFYTTTLGNNYRESRGN